MRWPFRKREPAPEAVIAPDVVQMRCRCGGDAFLRGHMAFTLDGELKTHTSFCRLVCMKCKRSHRVDADWSKHLLPVRGE